ncbi:hypothetical protein SDC9_158310 [bioreactor metagenome]|uniref:Uncharacterized protein n=1 Tax=bioreactor metagenome TaxID=1076179 RepID=A0A645FBR6_9ZZZZ
MHGELQHHRALGCVPAHGGEVARRRACAVSKVRPAVDKARQQRLFLPGRWQQQLHMVVKAVTAKARQVCAAQRQPHKAGAHHLARQQLHVARLEVMAHALDLQRVGGGGVGCGGHGHVNATDRMLIKSTR